MTPQEIRQLRSEMGVTQREFAQIVGVGASTIAMWESGKRRPDRRSRATLQQLRKRVDEKGGKTVAETLLEIAGTVAGTAAVVAIFAELFGEE